MLLSNILQIIRLSDYAYMYTLFVLVFYRITQFSHTPTNYWKKKVDILFPFFYEYFIKTCIQTRRDNTYMFLYLRFFRACWIFFTFVWKSRLLIGDMSSIKLSFFLPPPRFNDNVPTESGSMNEKSSGGSFFCFLYSILKMQKLIRVI